MYLLSLALSDSQQRRNQQTPIIQVVELTISSSIAAHCNQLTFPYSSPSMKRTFDLFHERSCIRPEHFSGFSISILQTGKRTHSGLLLDRKMCYKLV